MRCNKFSFVQMTTTTTTTNMRRRKTLEKKNTENIFTLQWRKKRKRKKRWNIVVVVYCKIALAKGISAFCSIIKSKAKKHHMTEFSFFLSFPFFFFFGAGTICIFFPCAVCCCRNVLQENSCEKNRKENKRNEIESTRQILEQRQTTFRLSQKNEYWRPKEGKKGKNVERYIIWREAKTCDTQTLRRHRHEWYEVICERSRKKKLLWRANTFLAMSCRKMTLVNLFFCFSFLFSRHHCQKKFLRIFFSRSLLVKHVAFSTEICYQTKFQLGLDSKLHPTRILIVILSQKYLGLIKNSWEWLLRKVGWRKSPFKTHVNI